MGRKKYTPFDTTKNINIIVKNPTRRRLGTGAPTAFIPGDDKGNLPVLIPSAGLLEQAEVDYIKEAEMEKRKKPQRRTQPRKISVGLDKGNYEVQVREV